jgi:hypothetical protein
MSRSLRIALMVLVWAGCSSLTVYGPSHWGAFGSLPGVLLCGLLYALLAPAGTSATS